MFVSYLLQIILYLFELIHKLKNNRNIAWYLYYYNYSTKIALINVISFLF